ncbi:MAG TPA: long-chain-fatty-acid--CoA ligase [Acidimicrobiales bacterium]|nr:long-chain-fatty-acid--CoA ligase [Acidimicrobiales bacterium]
MELPLTPLDLLLRARRLFPNRIGVIDGDQQWTYADFAMRCDRQAHALRSLGVQPGDRVAWLCGNTHELLEAYFGVLLAGAVLLPLNIRLAAAELRFCVDDAGARLLFRHPEQLDLELASRSDGRSGREIRTITIGAEYEALLAAQPDSPFVPEPVDESAPAELFYTSGTTGDPKGVVLTHRNLYLHAIHSALTNGISGDDVILHTISLFHVNGWGTPHYLTGLGGVHVLLPRFDAGEVLRLTQQHGVTRLFLVPTMVQSLLTHPSFDSTDFSTLRQISIGGAPTPPSMLAEAEDRFGCEVICGYGMTESSPTLTRSLDKPGEPKSRARRATTGLPILGVDARVLDDDHVEVPWDGQTPGEVCARSNHVMQGYWNRPEETADTLREGWLHTGDIAVVDPDGYLTIVDRKKDLIVSGGENVSSVQVENALAAHPAVLEVAVVGMADERWGEVPHAFVTLRAGAEATERELIDWVRERLAHFKAPKRVTFLDELPKGGTGKILKQALRARSG